MRAARGLLSAVTRLLILADIIDVNLMLKKLQQVENDLENLKNANSQAELMDSMGRFTHSAQELMAQAAKRSVNLTYTYSLCTIERLQCRVVKFALTDFEDLRGQLKTTFRL